jgi:CRP-like cAMP-binding protein
VQIEPLLTYFDSYLALNDEERAQLSRRVVERRLKRRQFVLQQGDVCRHYTFVVAGCLKLYGVDKKGTEHILQFAAENDWISDIGSFHAEQPSQLYIEAIEPAIILQLEKPNLLYFYRHYPKFNLNFRVIIENKFAAAAGAAKHQLDGRGALPQLFEPVPRLSHAPAQYPDSGVHRHYAGVFEQDSQGQRTRRAG